MAGAISRRIPAVSSLLINKLLFLELSCTQLLTSYHADISLINKQYRKRGPQVAHTHIHSTISTKKAKTSMYQLFGGPSLDEDML